MNIFKFTSLQCRCVFHVEVGTKPICILKSVKKALKLHIILNTLKTANHVKKGMHSIYINKSKVLEKLSAVGIYLEISNLIKPYNSVF